MSTVAAPPPPLAQSLEQLAHQTPRSAPEEPSWLTRVRLDAQRWVVDHGFPTKKEEDWRYLTLASILALPLEWSSTAELVVHARTTEVVHAQSLQLGGPRLVFVNGRFAPTLSRTEGLLEAVPSVASALAVDPDRVRGLYLEPRGRPEHAFSALNAALAIDGVLIDLPAHTTLVEPIEMISVSVPGVKPRLSCPRSLIRLGEGSKATFVETHVGTPGARYVTNAVTRVDLGAGAELSRYHLQLESDQSHHFSSLEVHQARASRFSNSVVAFGAETARHEVRVFLDEEDAEVSLDALYLPSDGQHHDHPILVEHLAPRCTSRQRYVGVVDGSGHGVFNGHVVVRPGAAGTEASQTNKNLLLSERAEVDTRPRLEILADDVACAHGAAVGRIDEGALFYLRSRGIPRSRARSVLILGFAAQMVERLALAPLRARVSELIATRLGLDANDPLRNADLVPAVPASPTAQPHQVARS